MTDHSQAALLHVVLSCHRADGHAPIRAGHPGYQPADGALMKVERRSPRLRHDDRENNDTCVQHQTHCNQVQRNKQGKAFEAEQYWLAGQMKWLYYRKTAETNNQELSHISIAQYTARY